MKPFAKLLLVLVLLGVVARGGAAESIQRITLPADRETFLPGNGAETVTAFCLACHSAEYVSTQPSLARSTWRAIVQKMADKFGAPVPADLIDPITDYLARTYPAKPTANGRAMPPAAAR